MVNLSLIDKNIYKSLGFKNKSIGQTMIKEVLRTKVTNFKTVPALILHLKPRISNLINLGFDVNDKKLNKQLKSIKKISKKVDKRLEEGNKNVEKIFVKWEQELMILLLLFLQKQSLAFAVYLFGIGTLHTGPGLKKKSTCDNALTMTSPVHW